MFMPTPDLSVSFSNITLKTPITLLSGCVGFGEELLNIADFSFKDIGAICLKGTTLEPRHGNKPHRLAETPAGLLNAIGLQNPGARHVVDDILPRWEKESRLKEGDGPPTRLFANISGSTVQDYGEVARIFDDSFVDAIEINISCPNVKKGGAAFGSDPIIAADVVSEVRKATSKPIITKLSPNVTDITQIAKATLEAGSDAFSVINTLMGMAIDIRTRKPVLGNTQGGLSGPAIKPVALLKVWLVYQAVAKYQKPILGQGGITSGSDAFEFFIAGSSAIGVGTALFRNPLISADINRELREIMTQQNIENLSETIGTLAISR
ncbi:MAG: dihydroorotate dehydrogenase [Magnetococcales bacterium]|nr:dihydroorotate dehydrogenase [Magnetococcales bacterium]